MDRIKLLVLRVTERCNLQCAYCYAARGEETIPDMDEAMALRAVELCCPQDSTLRIQFTGGEPLLRLDLMGAVAAFGKRTGRKLVLSVQTNGTLLTPQTCLQLRAIQCGVGVSLDGMGDANSLRTFPDGTGSCGGNAVRSDCCGHFSKRRKTGAAGGPSSIPWECRRSRIGFVPSLGEREWSGFVSRSRYVDARAGRVEDADGAIAPSGDTFPVSGAGSTSKKAIRAYLRRSLLLCADGFFPGTGWPGRLVALLIFCGAGEQSPGEYPGWLAARQLLCGETCSSGALQAVRVFFNLPGRMPGQEVPDRCDG